MAKRRVDTTGVLASFTIFSLAMGGSFGVLTEMYFEGAIACVVLFLSFCTIYMGTR